MFWSRAVVFGIRRQLYLPAIMIRTCTVSICIQFQHVGTSNNRACHLNTMDCRTSMHSNNCTVSAIGRTCLSRNQRRGKSTKRKLQPYRAYRGRFRMIGQAVTCYAKGSAHNTVHGAALVRSSELNHSM